MRIERHYYTASKREFDEAEAEVRKEREAMTEEERQAEGKRGETAAYPDYD